MDEWNPILLQRSAADRKQPRASKRYKLTGGIAAFLLVALAFIGWLFTS